MMNAINDINGLLKSFIEITANPTSFLSIQPDLEKKFKNIVKQSYDVTKSLGNSFTKNNIAVSKLIVDNFDVEQIWQQLELQNRCIYNDLNERIRPDFFLDKLEKEDKKKPVKFVVDESDLKENKQTNSETDEELLNIGRNLTDLEENSSDSEVEDKLARKIFDSDTDKNKIKSSFEERKERLQKYVQKLEHEALTEKPWQLKGEVSAKKRPQNSLLEQVLEFDLTTRPAPIITEEAALKLEDVIIKRIQNNAWDNVERKIKPIATAPEFRKKLVLDQEKSKQSLAKIYEQEYLKHKGIVNPEVKNKEEEEPKKHEQLNILMDSLFRMLDALSNYHFSPIPAVPELRIVTNLPAVELEEAIPAAVSDAMLLAPEEIQRKNKDLIGKEERTSADKNRALRQKKLKQSQKYKEIKKREKSLQPLKSGMVNKYSKKKIKKGMENLSKNTSVCDENTESSKISNSSNFFLRLSDTRVAEKGKTKIKRKKENVINDVKRIKL